MRKFFALFLTIALVALSAGAAWAAPPETVKVLIGFKGKADENLIQGHGGLTKHVFKYMPVIAAEIPVAMRDVLAKNPNVAYIEEDGIAYALGVVEAEAEGDAVIQAQSLPWGITKIGADLVQAAGNTGAGVKVAVIDTGIDIDHPDLRVLGGYNYVANNSNYDDDNGHGTHCGGIIAALNNTVGVVGVAPGASLYGVKVLNASGSGTWSAIAQGIEWAISNGMQVISMSLGGTSGSTTLQQACTNAWNANIVICAAAGNSGTKSGKGDSVEYPARYTECIAVAATDSKDARAAWSSTGPKVEVAAPGVSVLSCYYGGGYATMSGTSMATPHVAGLAALVIAAHPGYTNQQVRTAIDNCCVDLGTAGRDPLYGYGRVYAPNAVK